MFDLAGVEADIGGSNAIGEGYPLEVDLANSKITKYKI